MERVRCRCVLPSPARVSTGERNFVLPGARATYVPDRVVEPTSIALDVTLDFARGRVDGRATLGFRVLDDGHRRAAGRELMLDAVEMSLVAVHVDGEAVAYRYDGRRIAVPIGPRRRGEVLTVQVDYGTEPRKGLYFIRPDGAYPDRPVEAWTQGQDEDNRYWFPCLDHPSHKCVTEVRVAVPRHMFALSNGDLVADELDEATGVRRYTYRLDEPHASYLVTLVAGTFVTQTDRHGDVPLSYHVNPARSDDAQRTFARTPQMMALFERLTGRPYPYRRYSQIAVAEFIFGGMENTSATTLTDITLHDARAHLDVSSEPLVAHELAHQWFGDLVTCRDWAHGWLNEGFATYFEHLWKEEIDGIDEAAWDRLIDREAYLEEVSTRYQRPIVARVYQEPIDLFDRHLYEKGGAVLHMLRRELGDEAFWRGVKLYLDRHAGGVVETSDLQRALEDASGWSGAQFFDQFVYRGGHPRLQVAYTWDDEGRIARFEITQKLDEDELPWVLSLPVDLWVGEERVSRRFAVQRPVEVFHVACASAPVRVIVDPGLDLLAVIDEKKPEALWISQLHQAAFAIDRVRAARSLGKAGAPTARPALVAALEGDPFWAVRGEAAIALAALRAPTSRHALTERLPREPHPKARRLVVRALGAFRYDLDAARAVTEVLVRGDVSYLVESEAAASVGKIRAPDAFDALAAAIDRPAYRDLVSVGVLHGLTELRDERGIALARARVRYGAPAHARAAAIGALAALAAEYAPHRRAARETLAELAADDPDFRARAAAVAALATLGDAEAVAVLDRVAHADLDGRVRRSAREVARDLAGNRPQADQLLALRDRAEELEKARDELRDRVAQLEAKLGPGKPG